MRVESLLLYGKQAAEVIACAAPDGAEENHTIKVKIADEEAEHELDGTEVVWTLEKKT
jgi:hypothetical protein